MKRKQFIKELNEDLSNQVEIENYSITNVAKSALKTMIYTGVQAMTTNDLSSFNTRLTVKSNLILFIKTMTVDSKRRFMLKNLEYRSFINAKFDMRFLWPFF